MDTTSEPDDLVRQAWEAINRGDVPSALTLATNATLAAPERADVWAVLAQAQRNWGEIDQAIAAFRRALRIEPGNSGLYVGLGSAFEAKEQYADAAREYERAIQIDPVNPELRNWLGWAYFQQKRYPEAISALETALELSKDDQEIREKLVFAHCLNAFEHWTTVREGDERGLPPGHYATSREQVTQAQREIAKAEKLNCADEKVVQEIQSSRATIDAALKRTFHGSYMTPIFGGIIWSFFYGLGLVLAPLYFYVSRPPAFALNARLVAGTVGETSDEAARHEGGFGRLFAYALWGVFLPIAVVWNYVKNFTGENAPRQLNHAADASSATATSDRRVMP